MQTKTKRSVRDLVLAAFFLALGLVLPFLTGQIPQIGSMLLPMHIPVLLCGFVLGWKYGLAVGFATPLLRSAIFSMPPIFPAAVSMAFELAAYGLLCALLYRALPKKPQYIYAALILSMLGGRVVWGVVRFALTLFGTRFSFPLFLAGAFTEALPGIVLQLVLIPALVLALRRARLID